MSFKKAIIILSLLVKGFDYASGPTDVKEYVIKVRDSRYIPEILNLEPELKFIKEINTFIGDGPNGIPYSLDEPFDCFLRLQIIQRLCVFSKDNGDGVTNDLTYLSGLKQRLKDKVEYIEEVKIYYKSIENRERPETQRRSYDEKDARHKRSAKELVLQPPYYGLGIPEAWGRGYNGKGVVIGLTDVGVVTDFLDIRDNIDIELSKSFVIDGSELEPTNFRSYPEVLDMEHGNKCAGLIVGSMKYRKCTVGVAHGAKLAVLKIFKFEYRQMVINEMEIADALVFKLDKIHIFSNSWSMDIDYPQIPQYTKEVLKDGVMKGRTRKGRIHVFPPGGLSGVYANSPYTITVNAVGTGGRNANYSAQCACVLTTAYGGGHTNSSTAFITTSWNYINCTDRFIGTSPATAVVAGIIALLLQNNDHLTWREVQYLIIQSSSMDGIQDTKGFVKNAAGRFYHNSFGYGLINAAKLVSEAEGLKKLPKLIVYNSQPSDTIVQLKTKWTLNISCPCDTTVKECMTTVEQVVVRTSFTTDLERETELTLISPSQTKSYLMRSGQSRNDATKRENAEFLSVHFWDEKAIGKWTLILRKRSITPVTVSIQSFVITLYGHNPTYEHNSHQQDNIYQRCQDMIVDKNGVTATSSQSYISFIFYLISINELVF